MFRPSPGFTAEYHGMTLIVALDYDQWRILVRGPGVVIDGGRQPDRSTAKEEACRIAENYVTREQHAALPSPALVEWTPLAPRAFLVWLGQGQTAASAVQA